VSNAIKPLKALDVSSARRQMDSHVAGLQFQLLVLYALEIVETDKLEALNCVMTVILLTTKAVNQIALAL